MRSAIREMLKFTSQPDVISFTRGLPAPRLFPVERMRQAANSVLAQLGPEALQYSTTEGLPELRNFLAWRISSEVPHVIPENILTVTGSQQALDLLARIFVNEGAFQRSQLAVLPETQEIWPCVMTLCNRNPGL